MSSRRGPGAVDELFRESDGLGVGEVPRAGGQLSQLRFVPREVAARRPARRPETEVMLPLRLETVEGSMEVSERSARDRRQPESDRFLSRKFIE